MDLIIIIIILVTDRRRETFEEEVEVERILHTVAAVLLGITLHREDEDPMNDEDVDRNEMQENKSACTCSLGLEKNYLGFTHKMRAKRNR